jgi:predicted nucleic acid-binding protein
LILVDTSVWVDHFRSGETHLVELLERGTVVMHSFIVGELACGNLADRSSTLELLQDLPQAVVAEPPEVLAYLDRHALYGRGIGYVDIHLLASVALTGATQLWTRDRRLRQVAETLGCAYSDAPPH